MSVVVSHYINYHKLIQVASKSSSHYDKTLEYYGPLRLQDNARKHTKNQPKTVFLH